MGKGSEYIFFQRRYTNGQQAQEKMFTISNYQRNTNPKLEEISSHRHRVLECKLVQPLWKIVQRLLKRLKAEL